MRRERQDITNCWLPWSSSEQRSQGSLLARWLTPAPPEPCGLAPGGVAQRRAHAPTSVDLELAAAAASGVAAGAHVAGLAKVLVDVVVATEGAELAAWAALTVVPVVD